MRPITLSLSLLCLLWVVAFAPAPVTAQPVTIGEHVETDVATPRFYPVSRAPGQAKTWTHEIHFPGATYIAPHFAYFKLPEGDFLVVRSPDGEQSWRYQDLGKRDLGTTEGFFAAHIKGDRAVLELHAAAREPGSVRGGRYGIKIDRFGRGYNDAEIQEFWDLGLGEEMNLPYPPLQRKSLCGTDDTREAKCYQVSDSAAYTEGRAVARLMLSGNAHCTGWLIGCEGHVMTNEHCIGSQSQANNIDFEFDAEGATCATDCSSSLGCPGTIEASGGTLVAVDAALDYALVLPDTALGGGTDLNAAYGYMELRSSGAVAGERIYIPQHPAGWGKRFAMESTHAADTSGLAEIFSTTESGCSSSTVDDVGYYADTQGGSSGSPVLGYGDHKVVALHHCRGNSACTGTGGNANRGVPIQDIIADLGSLLPACTTCSPGAVADAGPNRSICLNDSVTLGTPARPGTTYSWSPGGQTTAQITVSPTTTTTYTVTATTSCGSAQDAVVVTVSDGTGGGGLSADFEGDTSGWTTSGLWHKTDDSSCAAPDNGYTSATHAFYYGQDSTCTYATGSATSGSLTSPPISGIDASSTLTFDYNRVVESYSGSYDVTSVDIVTASGSVNVFSLDSSDASSAGWQSSGAIPLGAFAGQTIQVRFTFDSRDSVSNGFFGWMIDDVEVTGSATCGGGPTGPSAIDWSATATESYSTQDQTASGSVTVEDAGATLSLAGNRWRRTTSAETFDITSGTVLEFDFYSTSEGEIHGIGFDEDTQIENAQRVFQVYGTQNWTSNHDYDDYATPGTWKSYSIPVGSYYTGPGMRLVLVNDKDSGTANNNSKFRNVKVYVP